MARRNRASTLDTETRDTINGLLGLGSPATMVPRVTAIVAQKRKAEDEAPSTISAKLVRTHRAQELDGLFASEKTALTNCGEFVWWFLDPCLLLARVLELNTSLARLLAPRLHSGGHLDLLFTADETYAGNPLHESGRKVWCCNYSCKQIPFAVRSQNVCWFCPAICRSKIMKRIPGGASRLFRVLLERMLFHPEHGLKTVGLAVTLHGSPVILFASFSAFFGDGDSMKILLEIKGAAGSRPCFWCSNVWNKGSALRRFGEGQVDISICSKAALKQHSNRTIRRLSRI